MVNRHPILPKVKGLPLEQQPLLAAKYWLRDADQSKKKSINCSNFGSWEIHLRKVSGKASEVNGTRSTGTAPELPILHEVIVRLFKRCTLLSQRWAAGLI